MNLASAALFLVSIAVQGPAWVDGPALPLPVANNAVAAVDTREGPAVFSFLGIDATKRWDGIVTDAFRWTISASSWQRVASVPGPGRLAATAQSVGGRIYLFGGYTVAEDGTEKSVPQVDIYDPDEDWWSPAAPMPTPVDDAVSGVWRDSLIVLVSGWHDTGNVSAVQIFDPASNTWEQGTPIPGAPVFGHAGGIADDVIVYLGGARVAQESPRFRIEVSAWRGDIDPTRPSLIEWRRLPKPPGRGLYRVAGGSSGGVILFVGGTANPYNYNGVGYDGVPSSPEDDVFGYDVRQDRWVSLPTLSVPTMDHRSVVVAGDDLVVVGGMVAGQSVTDHVARAPVQSVLSGR